jgi:selenocysteine lyase/cysteine desulfurase
MSFDVARARRETPGAERVVHFNNAGSSLPPAPVVEAMIDHLRLEAEIGGYEAYDRRKAATERPYAALAALLGCAADEIAVLDSATRAWDMAFYALALKPGDRIITGRAEYCSNLIAFAHAARRTGCTLETVPDDADGGVDLDALAAAIDGRTRLVAMTHVPTTGGLVNPAEAIGRITRAAGVPYLLDICQSAGQMPIDLRAIGCDMASGTGRKFLRGPRGTGFLYVRRDFLDRLDPPFLDDHAAEWQDGGGYIMRSDARRFETFECGFAAKIALGVAVDYAAAWDVAAIAARVGPLAAQLRSRIAAIPGARVHDRGRDLCGIVTFSLAGTPAEEIRRRLGERAVNVSVSGWEGTPLDLALRDPGRFVRASLHYYNTEAEIDGFVTALHGVARDAA